jgi:hypothetical protein
MPYFHAMKEQPDSTAQMGTLRNWKAIYLYLGVSESTARRWERLHGLPVMRMPGGEAFTTKNLIDQWVLARVRAQREALQRAREAKARKQGLTLDSSCQGPEKGEKMA